MTEPPPDTGRRLAEARREEARARFEAACQELRSSEGWQRFARARAVLRGYSLTNTLLILSQRPDATTVASYRRWIALGRQVRRGEQALRIWAPSVRRERDEATGEETSAVRRFVLVPVFDISQTDGPPLPEPPPIAPLTGESHAHLLRHLEEDAGRAGYRVERHDVMPGRSQGYVDHQRHLIVLASTLAPNGQIAVLVHELAHVHGARYDQLGRAAAEVVAETAAHIALAGVGLDTRRQSLPYVAGWADAAPGTLASYAEATHRVAAALESALGPGREPQERPLTRIMKDAHVAHVRQVPDECARIPARTR
ncbi:MAG: ArdC-like ssDNA-binding domain-containing protein [Dehalococcoidia bacterium]